MALIKCCECNHEISEYAKECPHCGCPIDIIKISTQKNTDNIIYNGKIYDFTQVKILLVENKDVDAIKAVSSITEEPIFQSKMIVDVIKFNNNEIPADYNECLKRMCESNSRRVNANVPKCPTCGSTRIQKISTSKKMMGAFGFGLLSKTAKSQFECGNCGYKW